MGTVSAQLRGSTCASVRVVTRSESLREIEEKMERVQRFLKAQNLGGVLLTKVSNFSWATAGIGDNHIVITSEIGAASLLLMRGGRKYLVASNNETARLMDEDLKGLGYEVKEFKWYEDKSEPDRKREIIRKLARGQQVGTDVAYADLRPVGDAFSALRYRLSDSEIKKYRWLGRSATEAAVAVCKELRPGMSERQIETITSNELMRREIRPTVLLIGVDERIYRFRHATPSRAKLRRYAMINICARRWGLVIALTRFAHFGPLPSELRARLRAAAEINARFQAHSTPGAPAANILRMAQQWYASQGFSGEWEKHHQGGAIGYGERDWVAHPNSSEIVHERQAFAWNPTIQGAKMEDTIMAHEGRIERLTRTPDWPMIPVRANGKVYQSPDILIR